MKINSKSPFAIPDLHDPVASYVADPQFNINKIVIPNFA